MTAEVRKLPSLHSMDRFALLIVFAVLLVLLGVEHARRTGIGTSVPALDPGGTLESRHVNLNKAEAWELEALQGIGPVKARKIIEYREAHGGRFESVDELATVRGLGLSRTVFNRLRPHLTVADAGRPHE